MLAALLLSSLRGHSQEHLNAPPREIPVCVINDSQAPVPQDLILRTLASVNAEYSKNTGIFFQPAVMISYSPDYTQWPLDLGMDLRRVCPKDTEIRMVFSNQRVTRKDLDYSPDQQEGNINDEFAGTSHAYFGFIVLLNFEARSKKYDAAGHPAIETALKHEIGHLFGLEHTPRLDSFMHTPSSRSNGGWTAELIEVILKNKDKRWYPRA